MFDESRMYIVWMVNVHYKQRSRHYASDYFSNFALGPCQNLSISILFLNSLIENKKKKWPRNRILKTIDSLSSD